ncbi:restriction endonuclease, partial [Nostoc sp. FACHB-973]|nr:restriction endonuclease [Nostoc sp. FACHB-973]
WPGTASLEVAYVWLRKGNWLGEFVLEDKPVDGITTFLIRLNKAVGNPYKLVANQNKSFIGSYVLGMGFVMTPEEAQVLIEKNTRNQDVLFPYLNGEDLNSHPDQSPSRWVINFKNYPLDAEHDDPKKPEGRPYAADYPDCLAILEERVKPERTRLNEKGEFVLRNPLPQKWWIYADKRPALYDMVANLNRVLVFAQTSKTKYPTFVSNGIVFDQKVVVIVSDSNIWFSILCSHIHYWWVINQGSSLRTDAVYTPSDVFETFPFPTSTANLEEIGDRYYNHRQNIMQTRQEGLTKTYNRFHNPDETAADIQQLRELHIEMDNAVAAAYGWQDLELSHGFHQTKQGLRFTISETARREVLDRLLELNHQRYAEEVAQGLHDKGKKKGKSGGKNKAQAESKKQDNDNGQLSLF